MKQRFIVVFLVNEPRLRNKQTKLPDLSVHVQKQLQTPVQLYPECCDTSVALDGGAQRLELTSFEPSRLLSW